MTLEGQQSIVSDHAMSVVGDSYKLAAACFYLDADTCGPGVE